MGIFNRKSKKSEHLVVTKVDQNWIEENFGFLVSVFGYPSSSQHQFVLDEDNFPLLFSESELNIENLIQDLTQLLEMDGLQFNYEIKHDIRDVESIPYEILGEITEVETLITPNSYKLFISNSLLNHPNLLVSKVIMEFVKIRLIKSGIDFDSGEDSDLFLYLAGVYFGFGVVLSQNLIVRGRKSKIGWDIKWNYVSNMAEEVMSFALAVYCTMSNDKNPSWKNTLSDKFVHNFDLAMNYLNNHKLELINDSELNARDLWEESHALYNKKDMNNAIIHLEKAIFLTQDDYFKSLIYNNIGYYQSLLKDFNKSIKSFNNSLRYDSDNIEINNNLAYSYLMLNEFSKAKQFLDLVIDNDQCDKGYVYRNMALYYELTNQEEMAHKYYKMAIEFGNEEVDLLEFYYGRFLIEKLNEEEKGISYIQLSANKNEIDGIEFLQHLKML